MKEYEIHPFAKVMPEMAKDQFNDLVKDIKANGLNLGVMLYQGKVLDGVHRQKACKLAGVKLRTQSFESLRRKGDDDRNAIAFVISENLMRRHMTTSQRAAAAKELANMKKHQKKSDSGIPLSERNGAPAKPPAGHLISQADAAKLMNVSVDSVKKAAKLQREDPEKFKAVKAGKVSLNKAVKSLKPEPKPMTKAEIAAEHKLSKKLWKLEKALRKDSPISKLFELCEADGGDTWTEMYGYVIAIRWSPCMRAAKEKAKEKAK